MFLSWESPKLTSFHFRLFFIYLLEGKKFDSKVKKKKILGKFWESIFQYIKKFGQIL